MLRRADFDLSKKVPKSADKLVKGDQREVARVITAIEAGSLPDALMDKIEARADKARTPVLGITGTGGAGKSSLTDEIVRRFRLDRPELKIAVLAVDPSRRKSGGALLGDRIRMNTLSGDKIYIRSLATRQSCSEIAKCLPGAVTVRSSTRCNGVGLASRTGTVFSYCARACSGLSCQSSG